MDVSVVEARHHEMAFQVDYAGAFFGKRGDFLFVTDGKNHFAANEHCRGRGHPWIVGINASVLVESHRRLFVEPHRLRIEPQCCEHEASRHGDEQNKTRERAKSHHFPFSLAMPLAPSTVSKARCKPTSRPAGSYHS